MINYKHLYISINYKRLYMAILRTVWRIIRLYNHSNTCFFSGLVYWVTMFNQKYCMMISL